MTDTTTALAAADKGLDKSLERLFDLLRIPSISTDAAYQDACEKAARWLVVELTALGFEATARKTPGRPMVVAHYTPKAATAKTPHVLFYGHYDVQPVDPVNLWHSPPFEPVRKTDKDGVERLYGRGTADDKGQLMTFVEAARAWISATGSLPIKATFLIEGEEESGSPSLIPFLKENKAELSCAAAFVCDSNMWDEKTPAITTRLRGMVHEEITITGPRIDLHSGMYGGAAMNPIRVLSKVLAALHDKTGKVTIPGFYDGVKPLPAATRKQWQSLKFSEKKFLSDVGLAVPAGEKGKSVLEQIWARPTAEVNGIWGGYTGAGGKNRSALQGPCQTDLPAGGPAEARKDFEGLPEIREGPAAQGLQGDFFRHGRRRTRLRNQRRQCLHPEIRRRLESRVQPRAGADGLRRFHSHCAELQGHSGHGQRAGGLWPQ